MDKIAIVILNWNGAQMLGQYLPSVLNYSRDEATVYVADNASTDNSVDLLRKHFPECKLILLDKNWGFADGYNKALAQIEAEYYLLLNSDIEVTHHWLTPLVEFMDNHPEVAACQPKLLVTAILSAGAESSRPSKPTMASMTTKRKSYGLPGQLSSCVRVIIIRWEDSMAVSLPITKR